MATTAAIVRILLNKALRGKHNVQDDDDDDDDYKLQSSSSSPSSVATAAATTTLPQDAATTDNADGNAAVVNVTQILEIAEEEHTYDAEASLLLNLLVIGCLLIAYYVKKFRMYYLPESAGALIVGVIMGGIIRWWTDRLQPFEFSPELFFFVLLPPIIFEAGYNLNRKDFFDNIGAITLFAMVGTMISTFIVGGGTYYAARFGLIRNVDQENPMEALLFGALISAVDPVATLSIMGNADLNCDPLVYSLVFGESVLNDAIAISLFKVFAKYYNPDGPVWRESQIPSALVSFLNVSLTSILVGVGLGLVCSFLYKHTHLRDYPKLETSLLFSFCYLCYATAESIGLSGIMALFFQGVVLSHYNSYNLSPAAHVASEQIFSTLACLSETVVFLYMGMGVFTGRFHNYDILFSVLAMLFCLIGRFLNIVPLSWAANTCRSRQNKINAKMQAVLWFAGLRGAIAFALAMNMPGPNRQVYATATLSICIFTTVVCGGLTDHMLTRFGMKRRGVDRNGLAVNASDDAEDDEDIHLTTTTTGDGQHPDDDRMNNNNSNFKSVVIGNMRRYPAARRTSVRVYKGAKRLWKQFDDDVLKVYFGGSAAPRPRHAMGDEDDLGNYELGAQHVIDEDDDDVDMDENDVDGDHHNATNRNDRGLVGYPNH